MCKAFQTNTITGHENGNSLLQRSIKEAEFSRGPGGSGVHPLRNFRIFIHSKQSEMAFLALVWREKTNERMKKRLRRSEEQTKE